MTFQLYTKDPTLYIFNDNDLITENRTELSHTHLVDDIYNIIPPVKFVIRDDVCNIACNIENNNLTL